MLRSRINPKNCGSIYIYRASWNKQSLNEDRVLKTGICIAIDAAKNYGFAFALRG